MEISVSRLRPEISVVAQDAIFRKREFDRSETNQPLERVISPVWGFRGHLWVGHVCFGPHIQGILGALETMISRLTEENL